MLYAIRCMKYSGATVCCEQTCAMVGKLFCKVFCKADYMNTSFFVKYLYLTVWHGYERDYYKL